MSIIACTAKSRNALTVARTVIEVIAQKWNYKVSVTYNDGKSFDLQVPKGSEKSVMSMISTYAPELSVKNSSKAKLPTKESKVRKVRKFREASVFVPFSDISMDQLAEIQRLEVDAYIDGDKGVVISGGHRTLPFVCTNILGNSDLCDSIKESSRYVPYLAPHGKWMVWDNETNDDTMDDDGKAYEYDTADEAFDLWSVGESCSKKEDFEDEHGIPSEDDESLEEFDENSFEVQYNSATEKWEVYEYAAQEVVGTFDDKESADSVAELLEQGRI